MNITASSLGCVALVAAALLTLAGSARRPGTSASLIMALAAALFVIAAILLWATAQGAP